MDKKGQVAGLNIFSRVIVMIFVIGLLVAVFVLIGVNFRDALPLEDAVSVTNETVSFTDGSAIDLATAVYRNCDATVTEVRNASNIQLNTGNYTVTDCSVTNTNSSEYGANWNFTYSYTYVDSATYDTANDSAYALTEAVDWFDLFIVIGAVVVLISLIVIVILLIRRSGMMGGGTA